jgi:hypothetical protein
VNGRVQIEVKGVQTGAEDGGRGGSKRWGDGSGGAGSNAANKGGRDSRTTKKRPLRIEPLESNAHAAGVAGEGVGAVDGCGCGCLCMCYVQI